MVTSAVLLIALTGQVADRPAAIVNFPQITPSVSSRVVSRSGKVASPGIPYELQRLDTIEAVNSGLSISLFLSEREQITLEGGGLLKFLGTTDPTAPFQLLRGTMGYQSPKEGEKGRIYKRKVRTKSKSLGTVGTRFTLSIADTRELLLIAEGKVEVRDVDTDRILGQFEASPKPIDLSTLK